MCTEAFYKKKQSIWSIKLKRTFSHKLSVFSVTTFTLFLLALHCTEHCSYWAIVMLTVIVTVILIVMYTVIGALQISRWWQSLVESARQTWQTGSVWWQVLAAADIPSFRDRRELDAADCALSADRFRSESGPSTSRALGMAAQKRGPQTGASPTTEFRKRRVLRWGPTGPGGKWRVSGETAHGRLPPQQSSSRGCRPRISAAE